jgi:ankyrin repeat protein
MQCCTPMWSACVNGHVAIVELLIKAGADVDNGGGGGRVRGTHCYLMSYDHHIDYLFTKSTYLRINQYIYRYRDC